MKCIAAVDRNWAIGKNNKLLVSIPADMRFFRDHTVGKVVIMGRATLQSFPGAKPLKNRINIVVTRDPDFYVPDAIIVHSVREAAEAAAAYPAEDVFVIGGASIYRQFLPLCDTAYITKIDYTYDADTYFPNLDADPEWTLESESEEQTYYDLTYNFTLYRRMASAPDDAEASADNADAATGDANAP